MKHSLMLVSMLTAAGLAHGAMNIVFPFNRTAYQTTERIPLAVVHDGPATNGLSLSLAGADGSRLAFTFATESGPAATARVAHVELDARQIRPGEYHLTAAAGGQTATGTLTIVSHIRRSDYTLINWGRTQGAAKRLLGEDSLGFNLFYGAEEKDNLLRGGVDYLTVCTMSGGHQMDLRSECDWSDPQVARGGAQRAARQAFKDRTHGNALGVHFYDEPGLTWGKDPETGDWTPHSVPAQYQAYENAFGRKPPRYNKVNPTDPASVKEWGNWTTWKLSFMDAAWKEAAFAVNHIRPDFLPLTQSQYGWSAFTDGYYFNVVRSLPIVSGHGGYHDFGPGYFNPSYFLEMARARDLVKPNWYLPTWYGNTSSDLFRLEQHLSFITGIEGLMSPPDLEPTVNPAARQGIVECNRLYGNLGPVFAKMPATRAPLALLYAMSANIHTQAQNRTVNYAHETKHGNQLVLSYMATRAIQQPVNAVVEEDVLDGTLAANHRAVVLPGLEVLAPATVAALEQFAANGGLVLKIGSTVEVKGAIDLGAPFRFPQQERIDALMAEKKYGEAAALMRVGDFQAAVQAGAAALRSKLESAGILPPFRCDSPAIVAGRQAEGDVEYLFAVNAAWDEAEGKLNSIKESQATLEFPGEGVLYDAVVGGPVPELGKSAKALFRFGPGQMRAFARTARPIGNVVLGTPSVRVEPADPDAPAAVAVALSVQDAQGRLLAGSVPVEVMVVDPLGAVRHRVVRATRLGLLDLSLPLAANDPAGAWSITARELLANHSTSASFTYKPAVQNRSLAGLATRALAFDRDIDNIHRFAKTFSTVTLIAGTSPASQAAAARVAVVLKPWGVECRSMPVAEAAKARTITAEEAATWIGLRPGKLAAGGGNAADQVGFAVSGAAVLIGTPEDNPLIGFLAASDFLPVKPDARAMPGTGHGLLAWQRDGIGRGQESVTLIAYDEAGMIEAIGRFSEAISGIEPLTRNAWAGTVEVAPAARVDRKPEARVLWNLRIPDRVTAIGVHNGALTALSHDGSRVTVSKKGTIQAVTQYPRAEETNLVTQLMPVEAAAEKQAKDLHARPDRMLKMAAAADGRLAVVYWGGTFRIADDKGNVLTEQMLPQDITALCRYEGNWIVGLADGRVMALAD